LTNYFHLLFTTTAAKRNKANQTTESKQLSN
jgi:hypothetical protein